MNKEDIEKIVASFFGLTPSKKIPKDVKLTIYKPEDIECLEKIDIKIKWENHIGPETNVARLTPLDVLIYKNMKYTKENYAKAVEMLKCIAKNTKSYIVKLEPDDKYLLINPRHRR